MKPSRPFSSRTQFNSAPTSNTPKPVSSFASRRNDDLNSRYQKAVDERTKMARAQFATEDSELENVYKTKGDMLERSIQRMEAELKDNKPR